MVAQEHKGAQLKKHVKPLVASVVSNFFDASRVYACEKRSVISRMYVKSSERVIAMS